MAPASSWDHSAWCRSRKQRLISGVFRIIEPTEEMQFGSVKCLHQINRNWRKCESKFKRKHSITVFNGSQHSRSSTKVVPWILPFKPRLSPESSLLNQGCPLNPPSSTKAIPWILHLQPRLSPESSLLNHGCPLNPPLYNKTSSWKNVHHYTLFYCGYYFKKPSTQIWDSSLAKHLSPFWKSMAGFRTYS